MKRLLKISKIFFDKELYPRINPNWLVIYDYSNSMKAGAKFPPITVALYEGKYYLIDGKHRIEATKNNREDYIHAEILKNLTREQIYIEAVKRNISHGYPLSPKEKKDIILKLEEMKYDRAFIQDLVLIPMDKMTNLIANSLIRSATGQVILKAPIQNLAGGYYEGDLEEDQKVFASYSQEHLLRQVIQILDKNMMDTINPRVLILWRELKRKIIDIKL